LQHVDAGGHAQPLPQGQPGPQGHSPLVLRRAPASAELPWSRRALMSHPLPQQVAGSWAWFRVSLMMSSVVSVQ
jgi:hypothetical protein